MQVWVIVTKDACEIFLSEWNNKYLILDISASNTFCWLSHNLCVIFSFMWVQLNILYIVNLQNQRNIEVKSYKVITELFWYIKALHVVP